MSDRWKDRLTMTREELFERLQRAYLRGVEWRGENESGFDEFKAKAASDYADAHASMFVEKRA